MTHPVSVRDARTSEIAAIAAIIHGVGLFTPEEADGFVASLPAQLKQPGDGHRWLLADDGAGAALLAPEPAPGVWNLLFLGVLPAARRRGVARALVGAVERQLRADGARMLLIDTSTAPAMAAARTLYADLGYEPVATIPDYWGPGDGKLTFRRLL